MSGRPRVAPARAHAAPQPLDIQTPAGVIGGRISGAGEALALCLPGIATNHRSFDALAGALEAGRRVAAIDLRGRGESRTTGDAGFGWEAHARDALAVAAGLGGRPLTMLGHSMGAFVAMQAASLAPGAIDRLVLIDGLGAPEGAALRSLARTARAVGRAFPSADAYVEAIRAREVVEPWSRTWDAALRYECVPARWPKRGVRLRTSRRAVLADTLHGASHDPRRLWPPLTMPVLLVRATVPLRPDGGLVVTAADRDRAAAVLPRLRVVEVPANHYGVVAHEATLRAVRDFVEGP